MPYDARYAVMSVRKKCGNQGGTTGYMSRPFWGAGLFCIPKSIRCHKEMRRKEENDERKTAEHQRGSIKGN